MNDTFSTRRSINPINLRDRLTMTPSQGYDSKGGYHFTLPTIYESDAGRTVSGRDESLRIFVTSENTNMTEILSLVRKTCPCEVCATRKGRRDVERVSNARLVELLTPAGVVERYLQLPPDGRHTPSESEMESFEAHRRARVDLFGESEEFYHDAQKCPRVWYDAQEDITTAR